MLLSPGWALRFVTALRQSTPRDFGIAVRRPPPAAAARQSKPATLDSTVKPVS